MTRNTRQFSDLNLLFNKHPYTGDVVKRLDEEAIKFSVKNLILTKNYERPFHPEIGCQITSLLFSNYSPVIEQVMKRTIFQVIEKFEPRVTVIDVIIRDDSDNNGIEVDIIFRINNDNAPITITATIDRIR